MFDGDDPAQGAVGEHRERPSILAEVEPCGWVWARTDELCDVGKLPILERLLTMELQDIDTLGDTLGDAVSETFLLLVTELDTEELLILGNCSPSPILGVD